MTKSSHRDGIIGVPGVEVQRPSYAELVFSIVIVWGFGDVASTLVAARVAGAGVEANPWIRVLLQHHPLAVVVLKSAVVLYAGVVLLECRSVVERVPLWRGWFLAVIAVGALVVLSNVAVGFVALSP